MAKDNEEFELFKQEFKQYQALFGLEGYHVYFTHEPINDNFASIKVNQENMIATVRFNSKLPSHAKSHQDIKGDAKHEALHLLLSRLEIYGSSRYVTEADMYEAAEELVNRLDYLIPNLPDES